MKLLCLSWARFSEWKKNDTKILGEGHLEIVRSLPHRLSMGKHPIYEPRLSAYPLVAGIAEGGWGSLSLFARARRLEYIVGRDFFAYYVEEEVAPHVAQELELLAQGLNGGVEVGVRAKVGFEGAVLRLQV